MSADAATVTDAALPPDAAVAADAGDMLDGSARDAATDAAVLSDAGSPQDASVSTDGGVATTARIRVMASNLTTGNNQSYDPQENDPPGPGLRIIQGLQPDIVLMQETRRGCALPDCPTPQATQAAMQELADLAVGSGAYWCREASALNGDIPNGIISRFPILTCGEWDDTGIANRDYAYAVIDVPGPVDLWAISVHFSTNLAKREAESTELAALLLANVPPGDLLVVGGDLNTDTADEPLFATLETVVETTPYPADQFGNTGTNTNRLIGVDGSISISGPWDPMRNQPYDWVLPGPSLMEHMVPVVLTNGSTTLTFPAGMVVDTRVFTEEDIVLVAPARLTDSQEYRANPSGGAPLRTNMQHMGVVRDFALPLQ